MDTDSPEYQEVIKAYLKWVATLDYPQIDRLNHKYLAGLFHDHLYMRGLIEGEVKGRNHE